MNDPKTVRIPASEIKRAYHEAIDEASDDTQPVIVNEGKTEATAPETKDNGEPTFFKVKDLKDQKITILPPILGREKLKAYLTDPSTGSMMEKVLGRTKEISEGVKTLIAVGFLEEQVDYIRKAICKKDPAKMEAYKQQFKALFATKYKQVQNQAAVADQQWVGICDLFTKDNPLGSLEPKEHFMFHENGQVHMVEATEARKKMMALNQEVADELHIPAPKKITCIKPNDPPMKMMFGVSQGIEPTFQKHYRRSVQNSCFKVGDFVQILHGEHTSRVGQVLQVDDPNALALKYVAGKERLSLKLQIGTGPETDVTCHACQVTKLAEASDFRRYDRVKLRFGSSAGKTGTVTRVNKCGYRADEQPWVFVMLDDQKDSYPCGFDAWKLDCISISNMPGLKLNSEVTYFADGPEYKSRKGKITQENDNGSVSVTFTDGQGSSGCLVCLGDIPRLLDWVGKDRADIFNNLAKNTGFTKIDEFYQSKPMDSMFWGKTMAEQEDRKNFYSSDLKETRNMVCKRINEAIESGVFNQIITISKIDYEFIVAELKYAPFLERHTARYQGVYKVILEPIPTKTPEHYPQGSEQRVLLVNGLSPTASAELETVIRKGETTICAGFTGKEVERPGAVTVDTRGIDPKNGKTVEIVGRCICELKALMTVGCKCGQPVQAVASVPPECTCPLSSLMTAGCKCGSVKK